MAKLIILMDFTRSGKLFFKNSRVEGCSAQDGHRFPPGNRHFRDTVTRVSDLLRQNHLIAYAMNGKNDFWMIGVSLGLLPEF